MKVDLTKEQIEFLKYLCFGVERDYEYYSVKEQREREEMADEIRCRLEESEDDDENIRHICDLYNESFAEINKKYQGGPDYNPNLNNLLTVALSQGHDAAHDLLHNETVNLVFEKLANE